MEAEIVDASEMPARRNGRTGMHYASMLASLRDNRGGCLKVALNGKKPATLRMGFYLNAKAMGLRISTVKTSEFFFVKLV